MNKLRKTRAAQANCFADNPNVDRLVIGSDEESGLAQASRICRQSVKVLTELTSLSGRFALTYDLSKRGELANLLLTYPPVEAIALSLKFSAFLSSQWGAVQIDRQCLSSPVFYLRAATSSETNMLW